MIRKVPPATGESGMTEEECTGPLHERNMRPSQAAEYLSVSESMLAKLRMRQNLTKGPRFARVGGCIVYRRSDLDNWVNSSMCSVLRN